MKIRYSIFVFIMLPMFFGCAVKQEMPKPMDKDRSVRLPELPSEPPPTEREYKKAVEEWASQYAKDCTRERGEKVTCEVQSISKPTYSPDGAWCVMVVVRIEHKELRAEAIATKDYMQETVAMKIENGKAQPYSSNLPKCN